VHIREQLRAPADGERSAHQCTDCLSATGGVCAAHEEPECACYEVEGGHQPGCAFYKGVAG